MRTPAIERMEALFHSGALVRPDAGLPNTVDLARAVHTIAGAPSFAEEAGAARIRAAIGESEHLVFVLADGLGMHLVEGLAPDNFLRRHLKLELQSVCPSSTGPALTSIATGVWPAEHAVPTWFTYLPEHDLTAIMLPFKRRGTETDLRELEVDAEQAFPAAVACRSFRRDYAAFQPGRIALSVYSRYSNGGRPTEGYGRLRDGIDSVLRHIAGASKPTFTYFYWPDIDMQEHEQGSTAPQALKEVAKLSAELSRMQAAMRGAATIVVSADHGQVTVPDTEKRVLEDGDELQGMLRVWPPAGEPRFVCFHVREGFRTAFRQAFERRFGEDFVLLSADEAEDLRLLGPGIMSPRTRARAGDFVAVPTGLQALGYEGESAIVRMKGFHGGLSPAEMRVPLIVA